ncbi:hypothetical protein [Dysgonomonas sp. GY617]|uniref:hypothetical protein n=1 Tax=Dysgonomonas sp. GY617 TaxID=2780420 RepID=UPI001883ADAE|nr:hypothetical protein [Dysgonomonas sp. GY617]MBF0576005.1 hypothetical protein [Dysgonomonas sp. GY617]
MKKYILLLLASMQVGFVSESFAQIGINTESPQQIFHIDGSSNTSGISNISDDVVVDSNGNLGVGVISPTAKLHIVTDDISLRLQDGTEGSNKMVYSKDASGNLSWIDQPESSATFFYLNTGQRNLPSGTRTLLISMPISEAANYLMFLRWWGSSTALNSTQRNISAYFFLTYASTTAASDYGTEFDGVEHYVSYSVANSYFSFTTSLFANITASTGFLKLWILPATPTNVGAFNWVIGAVNNNPALNPSIILFKI